MPIDPGMDTRRGPRQVVSADRLVVDRQHVGPPCHEFAEGLAIMHQLRLGPRAGLDGAQGLGDEPVPDLMAAQRDPGGPERGRPEVTTEVVRVERGAGRGQEQWRVGQLGGVRAQEVGQPAPARIQARALFVHVATQHLDGAVGEDEPLGPPPQAALVAREHLAQEPARAPVGQGQRAGLADARASVEQHAHKCRLAQRPAHRSPAASTWFIRVGLSSTAGSQRSPRS